MQQFFRDLENEAVFCDLVKAHYETVPAKMGEIFECYVEVDDDKLKQAHRKYVAAVQDLILYVDSKVPDHFKRAGALLIALHKGILAEVGFGKDWEEVEAGGGRIDIHYGDIKSDLEFRAFFAQFCDQMLAFMFSFQCCDAYEPKEYSYSFDYLRHICAYLQRNDDVDLETCFMLFKSLMDN